jgi:3-methylfumaryl-CoA hydratase
MSVPNTTPAQADAGEYAAWLGREESHDEVIDAWRVAALAATLDLEAPPQPGDALPPGWQWLFFNPVVRRAGLGADGHPRRGGFLPPIDLPRRMWAGSRIRYQNPVIIGATAHKRSRIAAIVNKTGRRGNLWFVTVEHVISVDGQPCIEEQQDIVYRDAPAPGVAPTPEFAPETAQWESRIEPDPTLLFRYSALTFNGHRIHYDQDYARDEEGYAGLVVHGPLTATLLQQFALARHPGRRLESFSFRGTHPLTAGRAFLLQGRPDDAGGLDLWARGPDGELAMKAAATLA